MEARINKMINYKKMLWSFMEFSQLNFQRIYEHQLTLLLDIGEGVKWETMEPNSLGDNWFCNRKVN